MESAAVDAGEPIPVMFGDLDVGRAGVVEFDPATDRSHGGAVGDIAVAGTHGAAEVAAAVGEEERHLAGGTGEESTLAASIDHDTGGTDDDPTHVSDEAGGDHVGRGHGNPGVGLHTLDVQVDVGTDAAVAPGHVSGGEALVRHLVVAFGPVEVGERLPTPRHHSELLERQMLCVVEQQRHVAELVADRGWVDRRNLVRPRHADVALAQRVAEARHDVGGDAELAQTTGFGT